MRSLAEKIGAAGRLAQRSPKCPKCLWWSPQSPKCPQWSPRAPADHRQPPQQSRAGRRGRWYCCQLANKKQQPPLRLFLGSASQRPSKRTTPPKQSGSNLPTSHRSSRIVKSSESELSVFIFTPRHVMSDSWRVTGVANGQNPTLLSSLSGHSSHSLATCRLTGQATL